MTPVAMTIAGSDPSGGAGLQADLKTFHQHEVYGTTIVTLFTVQNTQAVLAVEVLDPRFVVSQIDAVVADIPPGAAKVGALGTAAVIEAVAERAARFDFPLVVDPVMISKHGLALLDRDAAQELKTHLLPHAYLVTPNSLEAAVLAEMSVEDQASMEKAARIIGDTGPKHVLVKGGHLRGAATDVLWSEGRIHRFPAERVDTQNTHGSGCVFSAAITARLARGEDLVTAISGAKEGVRHTGDREQPRPRPWLRADQLPRPGAPAAPFVLTCPRRVFRYRHMRNGSGCHWRRTAWIRVIAASCLRGTALPLRKFIRHNRLWNTSRCPECRRSVVVRCGAQGPKLFP